MQAIQQIENKQVGIQPINRTDLTISKSIPFDDFKKALGSATNKYTDKQIEQMRLICDKIADLTFDTWLNKKKTA